MRHVAPVLLILWVALACSPPTSSSSLPIVNGTRETGEPAVVVVSSFGGLCSGTLITDRVVLTAKHCVQAPGATAPYPPAVMTVGVGDSVRNADTHRVRNVLTTPGMYTSDPTTGLGGALVGVDIGLLVLSAPIDGVTPIPIRRDQPTDMIGQHFTAIGFGRTPTGGAGLKYKGGGTLMNIYNDVLYTAMTICSGDSGGPMIQETPERRVIGVASFGEADACPSDADGYNGLWDQLDLIDTALLLSGECVARGDEVCNSLDDNCDGTIDEGCAGAGETCAQDSDCAFSQVPTFVPALDNPMRCEDLGAGTGMVCTRECDPLHPATSCGSIETFNGDRRDVTGQICERTTACEGRCLAGTVGAKADEEACAADTECASGLCANPGDGRQRCLAPCAGGAGTCAIDEVCVSPDVCGACVSADVVIGQRAFGEPCAQDAECSTEHCGLAMDAASGWCTRSCSGDNNCPGGYRCDSGFCSRGTRADLGEPCEGNPDCAQGLFCARQGTRGWCTEQCGQDADCGESMTCTMASGANICVARAPLLGESCTDACVAGVCEEGVCTRACGTAGASCPLGFECRRDGADPRCLLPHTATTGGGCCAVAPGAQESMPLALLGTLALLAVRRRRR